jgi:uncharacterized protein (TIGR03086 family)
MTTIDRYRGIAEGFGTRLDGVHEDQWSLPTPCTEWTVRELVGHVVRTQRQVLATLAGEEAEPVDLERDLRPQWETASQNMLDALSNDDLAAKTVGGMFGEQPFDSLVSRLVCTDTLVHTWDLARATGQDEVLDHECVERSFEFLSPIDDAIRRPGGFAPKIDPAPDANQQTTFLNFCGRAV